VVDKVGWPILVYSSAHIKDQSIKTQENRRHGVRGCLHIPYETLNFSLFRRIICASTAQ